MSPDGALLARAERSYPLSTPHAGWSEQDPEDWWRAAEAALAEVSAGAEVVGIGLSGQMHGLVALDAAGRVLRPAILWNDQRTGDECAEIEDLIGVDRLIELTGNRALAGFTAPKLLWLRRHEPATFAQIARICLPKDYVRLRLTGEWATDVADASGTLLFDVAGRRWSEEVLAAIDIPPSWLPPALESSEISGRFGDIPVASGAGDCAAAALGVGIDRPGPLSDRSRYVGCRVRRASRLPAGARGSCPHVLPCGARRVARHGRDARRRRLPAVVPRAPCARGVLRRPRRRSRRLGGGSRRPHLPPVPRRGAHAALRSECTRSLRRPVDAPRPRSPRPCGARGGRVRAAGLPRAPARARSRGFLREGVGRRIPRRRVAAYRRLRARHPVGDDDCGGGGLCLWGRPPRRRRRRHVRRRARSCRPVRPGGGPHRA